VSDRPSTAERHRILVVNSNTSEVNTSRIARSLSACRPEPVALEFATAANGPEGIDSALDLAIAGLETVRAIAANADAFDGFVIACGNDPGLDAARQVTRRPVVGLAESGMQLACALGRRFSIPVLSRAKISPMVDLVGRYGLTSRLASVVALDTSSAAAIADPDCLFEDLVAAGEFARDRDLAEVLVLTGSAFCGLEHAVSDTLGMPVVAGLTAAVALVRALCDLRLETSHTYAYNSPAKLDELRGYDDFRRAYDGGGTLNPSTDGAS
jgi:allantoin racemase